MDFRHCNYVVKKSRKKKKINSLNFGKYFIVKVLKSFANFLLMGAYNLLVYILHLQIAIKMCQNRSETLQDFPGLLKTEIISKHLKSKAYEFGLFFARNPILPTKSQAMQGMLYFVYLYGQKENSTTSHQII